MARTPKAEISKITKEVRKLVDPNKRAFERYPLLFTLLGTFGVTCTIYGFERLIDKIHFLSSNAYIPLLVGMVILVFTGTLYKKL